MPKITEITYSKGETRQIFAEYQPTNIHFSAKAEVLEGESIHDAYLELQKIVDEECAISLKILMEPQKLVRAAAKQVIAKELAKKQAELPMKIIEEERKQSEDPF